MAGLMTHHSQTDPRADDGVKRTGSLPAAPPAGCHKLIRPVPSSRLVPRHQQPTTRPRCSPDDPGDGADDCDDSGASNLPTSAVARGACALVTDGSVESCGRCEGRQPRELLISQLRR